MTVRRLQTWLAVIVIGVGVLLLGIAGLFVYVSNTAVPLHTGAHDVPTSSRGTPSAAWTAAVEQARQVVLTGIVEQNLPGVSVAVGVGGELVWAEGYGWSDLDRRLPVEPDTRFRIGTASVALTSAAVGLLLEQNRLRLDERIQVWVPEFPEKPWPVTLRQVMAHTAGIRNDGGDEGPLYGRRCARPVEALDAFADRDLLFEPGTQSRYSSFGWIVVSAAVEAAAGEPFLSFMRTRVFEPLGMRDTKADSLAEPVANMATSYFPRFAADPAYGPDVMRPVEYSCYAGASAFVSTPADLVRFGMAVHHGTVPTPEVGTRHIGTLLGGPVASLLTLPEYGIVVAVLSNTSYADTESLANRIAQAFVTR